MAYLRDGHLGQQCRHVRLVFPGADAALLVIIESVVARGFAIADLGGADDRDAGFRHDWGLNANARQLLDPAFIGLVEQALSRNGLAPGRLELELTERVLIGDGAQVRGALGRLRELGVSISLDDFGTGYSSLSYLTQFQIDTLKIDRAFVADMVDSPRSNALVATIVAMGNSLGLKLVAEGVETAGQARALEAMGCHYLQGYHISRPVGAAALLLFAAAHGAPPALEAQPPVLL